MSFLLPDPKRPRMMLRFRFGQESQPIWARTLRVLKQYPGVWDEIWFSTGIGMASPERHLQLSNTMAGCAEELRSIGITPSLQIQATLGHGDQLSAEADLSGRGSWGGFVGRNGEVCRYCNCPRQEGFLQYMEEVARIYASWKPGSVWIDDDLRLGNHAPAYESDGCYCPDCLADFAGLSGKIYDRESLLAACAEDPDLKGRWQTFSAESLCGVAGRIAGTFHKYSPETRMGFQHCSETVRCDIFQALADASGRRVGSRSGGGAYSDHDPYEIIEKGFFLSQITATQPGYELLSQICPEIESCPRVFCCKTPEGHRLESMFYLAMGMDSLSYFILDPLCETPEWYGENLLAPLAAETPCYREFIAHNEGTVAAGLSCSRDDYSIRSVGLPVVGIPCAGFSPAANCRLLTEQTIRLLSEKELQEALAGNVLLNGEAVIELRKRGKSTLIGNVTAEPLEQSACEYYTDIPFNTGIENIKYFPYFPARTRLILPENFNGQLIGEYKDSQGNNLGAASILLHREDGTRVAILGFSGFFTQTASTSRVRFLYRVIDWLSGGTLPVLPMEPVQCIIVPRISRSGMLRSITVINAVIGRQKPFSLQLRNVPERLQSVQWIIPAEKAVTLPIQRHGAQTFITLPAIAPWAVGWLKF